MFVCPGANYPDGYPHPPAKWCKAAGVCAECGSVVCGEHGCQLNPGHATVKAAS